MLMKIDPEPQTILDVGAGAGQWYDLLRPWFPDAKIDAVEIFAPYVERYGLRDRYDHVIIADARGDLLERGRRYDLVIFGDVIEHMTRSEAMTLLAGSWWRHALVSIPIGDCPQDGTEENPYEAHIETWSVPDVLAYLPGVTFPYYAEKLPPPDYGRGVFLLRNPQ